MSYLFTLYMYSGLTTQDKTSETTVWSFFLARFTLHSGFLAGQNWLISLLNHLVNHQNT